MNTLLVIIPIFGIIALGFTFWRSSWVSKQDPGTDTMKKIADNIAVKVPLTIDGLKTCKKLSDDGTMVNVTLCFSANQALLAAIRGGKGLK